MNREELKAHVEELERWVVTLAGATVFHADKERKAQNDLTEARAELAAMTEGPRRVLVTFNHHNRPLHAFEATRSITSTKSRCEMIEIMPASKELLLALKDLDETARYSGLYGSVTILARELRARLPKP